MNRKFFLFAVVAMILVAIAACSKDELGIEVIVPQQEQMDSYRVSVDEALRSAETILRAGDRDTRSAARRVKSTELYVAKPATRSNENAEVSFYLINYEDNAGYALVSTDERTTPVYMYAEEGNITTEAFEEVPPLAIFMEEAVANYEAEVASYGADEPIDIGFPPGMDGRMGILDGEIYYLNIDTTYVNVGPYSCTQWHQQDPYGNLCDNLIAGCVPVAMGQIMAYYKHPASFGDTTFDWELMTAQPSFSSATTPGATNVMELLHKIGITADADYSDPNSTGVEPGMMPITFLLWGYSCSMLNTYSSNTIINDLNSGKPVIAGGYRYNEKNEYVGHSWVIHGYHCIRQIQRYYYTTPPYELHTTIINPTYYFRNNLGQKTTGYHDLYLLDTEFIYPIDKKMITGIEPDID